jgi:hypothetical protein
MSTDRQTLDMSATHRISVLLEHTEDIFRPQSVLPFSRRERDDRIVNLLLAQHGRMQGRVRMHRVLPVSWHIHGVPI